MEGQGARIAMLWDDLSPNAGGAVYVDSSPTQWMVTFDQVPQFNTGDSNTFQVQIRPDGSFTLAYGTVAAECIAGVSFGNDRPAQQIDLTADLPLSTWSAIPATYTLSASPALGTTVDFQLNDLPANASVASVFIGVNQLENDLAVIGMPTCFQYTETALWIDCPAPMAGSSTLTLALPNDPALLGARFVTQGAAVALGINALGVVSSNAIQVNLGR